MSLERYKYSSLRNTVFSHLYYWHWWNSHKNICILQDCVECDYPMFLSKTIIQGKYTIRLSLSDRSIYLEKAFANTAVDIKNSCDLCKLNVLDANSNNRHLLFGQYYNVCNKCDELALFISGHERQIHTIEKYIGEDITVSTNLPTDVCDIIQQYFGTVFYKN